MNALGNIVAIGIPKSDAAGTMSGMVKVFQLNGNTWDQMGTDIIGNAEQKLGFSLALNPSGNKLVIGCPDIGGDVPGTIKGKAKVFEWDGNNWLQLGSDIEGLGDGDEFGYSVDINTNGTRIVVGEKALDYNNSHSGRVAVFEYDGQNWNQIGSDLLGAAYHYSFGWKVDINSTGNKIIVSAKDAGDNLMVVQMV